VILVDANLLVYAKMDGTPQHPAARAWLEARLSDVPGVALPWNSLLAFVRLTTNPRIFERPLAMQDAWRQVREWTQLQNVFLPEPADRYPHILDSLMRSVDRSTDVPDAHLAALALEYDLTLASTDHGFARFRDLRWVNPIA